MALPPARPAAPRRAPRPVPRCTSSCAHVTRAAPKGASPMRACTRCAAAICRPTPSLQTRCAPRPALRRMMRGAALGPTSRSTATCWAWPAAPSRRVRRTGSGTASGQGAAAQEAGEEGEEVENGEREQARAEASQLVRLAYALVLRCLSRRVWAAVCRCSLQVPGPYRRMSAALGGWLPQRHWFPSAASPPRRPCSRRCAS